MAEPAEKMPSVSDDEETTDETKDDSEEAKEFIGEITEDVLRQIQHLEPNNMATEEKPKEGTPNVAENTTAMEAAVGKFKKENSEALDELKAEKNEQMEALVDKIAELEASDDPDDIEEAKKLTKELEQLLSDDRAEETPVAEQETQEPEANDSKETPVTEQKSVQEVSAEESKVSEDEPETIQEPVEKPAGDYEKSPRIRAAEAEFDSLKKEIDSAVENNVSPVKQNEAGRKLRGDQERLHQVAQELMQQPEDYTPNDDVLEYAKKADIEREVKPGPKTPIEPVRERDVSSSAQEETRVSSYGGGDDVFQSEADESHLQDVAEIPKRGGGPPAGGGGEEPPDGGDGREESGPRKMEEGDIMGAPRGMRPGDLGIDDAPRKVVKGDLGISPAETPREMLEGDIDHVDADHGAPRRMESADLGINEGPRIMEEGDLGIASGETEQTEMTPELADQVTDAILGLEEETDQEIENLPEEQRNVFMRGAEWYRNLHWGWKIGASAVLFTTAAGAAAVGGVVGTAMAAAAFTGSSGQRILGGMATFLAVDGLLQKRGERDGEGDNRTDLQKRWNKGFAIVAGLFVGTGALSHAISGIAEIFGIGSDEVAQEIDSAKAALGADSGPALSDELVAEQASIAQAHDASLLEQAAAAAGPISIEHPVVAGDNLWKIIEANLEEQGRFEGMDESGELYSAEKTHLIDAIKDKFEAMSPEELKGIGFSSGDIDELSTKDTLNLTEVLGNNEIVDKAVSDAGNLTDAAKASIEANNRIIADYAEAHPDVFMSSEKVAEILNPPAETESAGIAGDVLDPEGVGQAIDVARDVATSTESAGIAVDPLDPVGVGEAIDASGEGAVDEASPSIAEVTAEASAEATRQAEWANSMMEAKINDIYATKWYNFGLGSNQAAEWFGNPEQNIIGIQDMPAHEVLAKNFGDPVGLGKGAIEWVNQKQMLEFLQDLSTTSPPGDVETTKEYMLRVLGERYETIKPG